MPNGRTYGIQKAISQLCGGRKSRNRVRQRHCYAQIVFDNGIALGTLLQVASDRLLLVRLQRVQSERLQQVEGMLTCRAIRRHLPATPP